MAYFALQFGNPGMLVALASLAVLASYYLSQGRARDAGLLLLTAGAVEVLAMGRQILSAMNSRSVTLFGDTYLAFMGGLVLAGFGIVLLYAARESRRSQR